MHYATTCQSVLPRWGLLACLTVGALRLGGCRSETPVTSADALFTNGHIFTSNPALPWVEAVATRDGKIVDVGTAQELAKYRGIGTHILDLAGRMAMPGIIDNHTHFLWGSYGLVGLQLREARSMEEMKKLARE
jgi:predicted amidohydrolase YtcJ